MLDFRFSNEQTSGHTAGVMSVLEKPRLWIPTKDYPDYFDWLGKVGEELEDQQKRAMVAYQGKEPVGSIVYQRCKTNPSVLEIKNISVNPDLRGRHIASFLLRNTEIEGSHYDFPGCTEVVVDTKLDNHDMAAFLIAQSYLPSRIRDLYGLTGVADIILAKAI
jgi:ribosomal protein S18 acetylase RimI-like enzyme